MLSGRKIDLALEAKELAEGSPQKTTRLSGVKAQEDTLFGYPLTRVDILDQAGEAALGKPKGAYLTLDLPQLPQDREETLRAARAVAAALEALPVLPKTGTVLVAGLGNRQVTPDAIGPRSTEFLLVTRHLVAELPEDFGTLRPVAALAAGVTGSTGMESGEILGAVVEKLRPACLIAVDALAARRQERVCRTIQVSDTGIVPGSGVGNARMALDQAHLGIPVIAIGVPPWWKPPPSAWICWRKRGKLPSTPPSSASRGRSGSSPPETSTGRWKPLPASWALGSAPPFMWIFPWKMWKSGSLNEIFDNVRQMMKKLPVSPRFFPAVFPRIPWKTRMREEKRDEISFPFPPQQGAG